MLVSEIRSVQSGCEPSAITVDRPSRPDRHEAGGRRVQPGHGVTGSTAVRRSARTSGVSRHPSSRRCAPRSTVIDEQLVRLLNRRAELAIRVGHAKARGGHGGAKYAPEREKRIFQRLARLNGGPLRPQHVRTIFREVISSCLALEQPLRIAYLGPAGTYSQQAAAEQFGSGAALLPFASIDAVFDEVERGRAEYGVVPVENSTEGVVAQTLDRFISSPLSIKAEVLLRIDHCLLAQAAAGARVRRIVSHPQSLAQCRTWLAQHFPGVPVEEVASNAAAAALAARHAGTAAIAGRRAAERYRLKVVAASIQDQPNNVTRFLVISNDARGRPTGDDKTSILFAVPHEAGALFTRPRRLRAAAHQPEHHRVAPAQGARLGVRLLHRPRRPRRRAAHEQGARTRSSAGRCSSRCSAPTRPGAGRKARRNHERQEPGAALARIPWSPIRPASRSTSWSASTASPTRSSWPRTRTRSARRRKRCAALQSALADVHRYPDGSCYHLRRALARKLRVAPEALIFGNGSNEIIELIVRTFLHAGEEAVMADQAFVIYRMLVQAQGGKGIVVPLRNFTHDLEAMAEAITPATRLVFLANPNNPTGTIFFREQWEEFLAAVPRDVIIVMDEAYAEFVEDARYPGRARRPARRPPAHRAAHLLEDLRPRRPARRLRRRASRTSSTCSTACARRSTSTRSRRWRRWRRSTTTSTSSAPDRSTARAWPTCARRSTASASSTCRAGPTSCCVQGRQRRAPLRRAAAPGRHRAPGAGVRLPRARARHRRHARRERAAGAGARRRAARGRRGRGVAV